MYHFESFERVDSLSFGQTAIYLFPLAFAIKKARKKARKKRERKNPSVFLAVYRCASSAIPEMKGDLASVPHFAVTTSAYTRRRWRCGKQKCTRRISKRGRNATLWSR